MKYVKSTRRSSRILAQIGCAAAALSAGTLTVISLAEADMIQCAYHPNSAPCPANCSKAGPVGTIQCCLDITSGGLPHCCSYANGTGQACYPNGDTGQPPCSDCPGGSPSYASGDCGVTLKVEGRCRFGCGQDWYTCRDP